MRPILELDLDIGGKGKVAIDSFDIPFATAVRLEARVGAPTRASIDFHPATTVMRMHRVDLSHKTIEGLEAICREWRKENDDRPPVDMNALRAFELWLNEATYTGIRRGGEMSQAFDRFVGIYREEVAKA